MLVHGVVYSTLKLLEAAQSAVPLQFLAFRRFDSFVSENAEELANRIGIIRGATTAPISAGDQFARFAEVVRL